MSHTNIQHRRTHNLLLISKLLSQRDAASPFTLVLDSLEQTAKVLIREYIRRASNVKTQIIFLGFETVKIPNGVDVFIPSYDKTPGQIQQAISNAISSSPSRRHHLLLIDSINHLCTQSHHAPSTFNLTHFLSSLITPPPPSQQPSPTTSLVAIYHTDIPLPPPPTSHLTTSHLTHQQQQSPLQNSYTPSPLKLLTYLATTILTLHPLSTLLATQAAQSRSLATPIYGLDAGKEGVVVGLKPARYTASHLASEMRGVVVEMEHRRRSGRGVGEWYFLPLEAGAQGAAAGKGVRESVVCLLDDHPLFRASRVDGGEGDQTLAGMTFELGLTDRQKMEREGVVLPYFDAQRDGGGAGPGEGGRILYDMGVEDDFDEEEDEI